MKLRLKKISTKSFILIFSTLNVITGVILGAVVTVGSILAPNDQNSGVGVWAVLIFPILNGVLGLLGGVFLTQMYNLLARFMGGIELEFESIE
jgi:hypothetical protein